MFDGKIVPLHPLSRHQSTGEMVEWSITAVLKTAALRGAGGSNPSLSAKSSVVILSFFFVFLLLFYKKVEEKFGRVTKFSYFCSDE